MAQIVLFFSGSVLLALSLSQEMSPRCFQLAVQKTNGCSVPAGLWAPYKNSFTPACYKHDFCYFCVSIACLVNTNLELHISHSRNSVKLNLAPLKLSPVGQG